MSSTASIDARDPTYCGRFTAIERYLRNDCDVPATERLYALVNDTSRHGSHIPLNSDVEHYQQLFPHLELDKASIWQAQHPPPPCKRPRLGPSPRPACSRTKMPPSLSTMPAATHETPPPSLDSRDPSMSSSSPCTDLADPYRMRMLQQHPRIVTSSSAVGYAAGNSHHHAASSVALPAAQILSTAPSSCRQVERSSPQDSTGPSASFPCAFWFLGCKFSHPDLHAWLAHCQFHIRARPVPSAGLTCTTCNATCEGWYRWLKHLADHRQQIAGWDVRAQPVDDALVVHLWCMGLIDTNQRLELMRNGRIGEPHQPFLNMHNARAEKMLLRGREVVASASS